MSLRELLTTIAIVVIVGAAIISVVLISEEFRDCIASFLPMSYCSAQELLR